MKTVSASAAGIMLAMLAVTTLAGGMRMPAYGGEYFPFGHPGSGSGPVHVIHIRALDTLRFDPSRIVVTRGETVKFVITNDSKLTHEFVIGDAVLQAEHDKEMQAMPGMEMHDVNGVALPPGRTRDLVWTFTRDGTVEYACHIPGHFAAGMVGKIIIESAKHG